MKVDRDWLVKALAQLAESEPEVVLERLPDGRPAVSDAALKAPTVPELEELARQAAGCTRCGLAATRRNVVFGVGNHRARLMLVGEAPGADEDAQGEPFVGRAGQLLNRILTAMGIERKEVYIANILKCRPPDNRNPTPAEAAACLPYLRRQVELVSPRVVTALGAVAAVYLLNLNQGTAVKSLRGRVFNLEGRPLVVTYHPAALLRNPALKAETWGDMQMVMKLLSGKLTWSPEAGLVENA